MSGAAGEAATLRPIAPSAVVGVADRRGAPQQSGAGGGGSGRGTPQNNANSNGKGTPTPTPPPKGLCGSARGTPVGISNASPQTRHAARDLREPVSKVLSAGGRESRDGATSEAEMLEHIATMQSHGSQPLQHSFTSDGRNSADAPSPSIPAGCASPLAPGVDAPGSSRGMYPIKHDLERRGSQGGGRYATFGGSLVEPASLQGGVSPMTTTLLADTPTPRVPGRLLPLNTSPQPPSNHSGGCDGRVCGVHRDVLSGGSSADGGTPLPPPELAAAAAGTPTKAVPGAGGSPPAAPVAAR